MRWFVNFVLLWSWFLLSIGVLDLFGVTAIWTSVTAIWTWNGVIGISLWFAFLALFIPVPDLG